MVVDRLFEDKIQVLLAQNHPLSYYEQIPWQDLARYPQVVFKDGYGMRRVIQEQFERQGLALNAALELNTLDAFRGVVRRGQSLALLPHSALMEAQADPSLVIRATGEPTLTREVVCVTTVDRLQIPPIQRFRELLKLAISQSP
jgi:DNA-binding transcriptional LysR family regulator